MIPGPADYAAPELPRAGGGRFNAYSPMSDLERLMKRAAETPAPSDYSTGETSLLTTGMGRISTAKVKSEIDWIVYHSKDIPGPSQYDVSGITRDRGGRASSSATPSRCQTSISRSCVHRRRQGQMHTKAKSSLSLSGGRISTAKPQERCGMADL